MGPGKGAGGRPQGEAPTRRSVLRGMGAGALATGAGGILAACSSGSKISPAASSTSTINIGYIAPFTGSLAGFASADKFVVSTIRNTPAFAKGFKAGGKTYQVNIIVNDSQSDPNRASQLARQLILNNNVDLLLTSSTPETVNPVAVVAQTEGVPCAATNDPWESWYSGLGGNPAIPTAKFQYCTLFFFGLKQLIGSFIPMWKRMQSSSTNVACQWPNDSDGNAFRAVLPPVITAAGFTPIDGGAYTDGTTDYSTMIGKFKSNDCQYMSNCPLPPDFNIFWKQAHQLGWKPKLATVAKVLLFPDDTAALGPLVNNIATDSWWGPYLPDQVLAGPQADRERPRGQLPGADRPGVGPVDRGHLQPVRDSPPGVHQCQRPARPSGGRPGAAQGELPRDVRPPRLHQRPGAGGRRHPRGRRAVEGEFRQVSLRDEGR